MKKLNVPIGLVFGLLSIVSLSAANWLAATTAGLLSIGFFLSDVAYFPPSAASTAAPPLPSWRRYGSMLLIVTALILLAIQIGYGIGEANHTTSLTADPNSPDSISK